MAWYELSLLLEPSAEAAAGLAKLYVAAEQPGAAARVWAQLAETLPPEDAGHWQALGESAALAGGWADAAAAFGKGAGLSDTPYELWLRQAAAFRHLALSRDEDRAYHEAVRACPACVKPYLQLGHLWRREGQDAGALAWYVEAGRIAPENAYPPYYRAQLLYAQGKWWQAVVALEEAIALHKGSPWRWAVQLGDWRLEGNDEAGALMAYREALEWAPSEVVIVERIEQVE
jgi:tetratricopeptide (TPR) repeat protein